VFNGRKLLILREKKFLTQEQLSAKIGLYRQSIIDYEKGKSVPRKQTLQAIADFFEVDPKYFLTEEEKNITRVNEPELGGGYVKEKSNAQYSLLDQVEVPLLEMRAQAGYLRGYKDPEYMESLPKVYVSREFDHGGNFMAFRLGGDSMDDGTKRSFCDNDIVLCRELHQKYWSSKLHLKGLPFAIVHEDGILFKEIISHDVDNGIIRCHSWNPSPEYEDFDLNLSECRQIWYYRRLIERK